MGRLDHTIKYVIENEEQLKLINGYWQYENPTPQKQQMRAYQHEYYDKEYYQRHIERFRRSSRVSMAIRRNPAWAELKAKYNHRCLCCGRQEPEIKLTIDHVIPLTEGGPEGIENVQPLCWKCNSKKGTKTIDYRPESDQNR